MYFISRVFTRRFTDCEHFNIPYIKKDNIGIGRGIELTEQAKTDNVLVLEQ